jgi:DNA-binding MarR family transcriptional regulator
MRSRRDRRGGDGGRGKAPPPTSPANVEFELETHAFYCSMQQLAEHSAVDRTTLAHTVALMARQGLITRTARKTDRRSVVLTLSARGRSLLARILPTVLSHSSQALSGFTVTQTRTLFKLLQRIADNIEA